MIDDIPFTLLSLPVELLYELQLLSLSESLPYVNRHCHAVFQLAPLTLRADYLISRFEALTTTSSKAQGIVTRTLRYPICTMEVMEVIFRNPYCPRLDVIPELPRRLFKPLVPKSAKGSERGELMGYSAQDAPLPFLRYLYESERIRPPDPNTHDGYALTKAVHAEFVPLIRFLLDHGASPKYKDGLAVKVAIRKKDLAIVRMLIERDGFDAEGRKRGSAKRRKKGDRLLVTVGLLKEAVKADARDIVAYFMQEKGVAPDLRTLSIMEASGLPTSF